PVAERLARAGFRVRVVAQPRRTAQSIVVAAQTAAADLIVMCAPERTGLRRVRVGSVAGEVLCQAPVPVLLVRASEAPIALGSGPYRRILVPLDGTAFAEATLSYVAQTQLDRQSSVLLLRLVPSATVLLPFDPLRRGFQ